MAGVPQIARRKSVQLVAVGLVGIGIGAGSGGGSSHQSAAPAAAPKPVTVTRTVTKTVVPKSCPKAVDHLTAALNTYSGVLHDMAIGEGTGTLTSAQVSAFTARLKGASNHVTMGVFDGALCKRGE